MEPLNSGKAHVDQYQVGSQQSELQPPVSFDVAETPPANSSKDLPVSSQTVVLSPTDPLPAPLQKSAQPAIRRQILLGLLGLGAIAAAVSGYRWWHYATTHEETNNAYVAGHIHPVNARIAGTVITIPVEDNQPIRQGDLLVRLDPRDYEVALQQAQAALQAARHQASVAQTNINVVSTNAQGQTTQAQGNIDAAVATIATAEGSLAEAQAGVPAAQANLAQVEANLAKAKLDYDRYTQLLQDGAVPQQQLDAAKASYDALIAQRHAIQEQVRQADAKVVQAQKSLTNTEARLASTRGSLQQANATTQQTEANRRQYQVTLAAIAQAEAQVNNAQLQLSYTRITAINSGRVGNKTVEIGQRVQPGQILMSVVQDKPWIIANFKETQLAKMQSGQQVMIKIDSLPDRTFQGRVDSLSPASGAKFSLLPPDNATGNFTKIVQRVPVKIVFDPESIRGYESRIAPGISVVVAVEANRNAP